MKPVFKVLIVVLIVLLSVHVMKHWKSQSDTYIPWIQQEFETVPPQAAFTVTPPTLLVNANLTAMPQMAQVAQVAQPIAMPVALVPTAAPSMAVA